MAENTFDAQESGCLLATSPPATASALGARPLPLKPDLTWFSMHAGPAVGQFINLAEFKKFALKRLPDGPLRDDILSQKRLSCQYCRKTLPALGYYFTCHVCGATYCYIHMMKHSAAHPRVPKVIANV
jgi:hypothetical protein